MRAVAHSTTTHSLGGTNAFFKVLTIFVEVKQKVPYSEGGGPLHHHHPHPPLGANAFLFEVGSLL